MRLCPLDGNRTLELGSRLRATVGIGTTNPTATLMCNHDDWYSACLAGTATGMGAAEEMVSDYTSSGNIATAGSTSCTWTGYQSFTNAAYFRCCIK